MPQGLESVNKNTKENTHTCVSAHTYCSIDITGGAYSSKGLHREVIECSGWHYNKPV